MATVYREACYDLGKSGERAKALELCQDAVGINEALTKETPNDVRARLDLSSAYGDLGMTLADGGGLEQAIPYWRKALACAEPVAAADPNNARALVALALTENQLGLVLAKAGKSSDLNYELKALAIRKKLSEADPKNKGRQEAVAISYATLADTEEILASRRGTPPSQKAGHWRAARNWYQQALQIYNVLRAQAALRGEDAEQPDRMAREIQKCTSMLGEAQNQIVKAVR